MPSTEELLEHAVSVINTLESQVQFCVDYMDEKGILEEHCFTFPDGETVWATQTLAGENDEDS